MILESTYIFWYTQHSFKMLNHIFCILKQNSIILEVGYRLNQVSD